MRCLEHIPLLGHAIAAVHACRGDRNKAERAAINATVGIVMAPVNIVAEMVDEVTREHPHRLHPVSLITVRNHQPVIENAVAAADLNVANLPAVQWEHCCL